MSNNATHDTPQRQHPKERQDDRTLYQYVIGDLRIIELRDLPFGQTWTVFRDMNIIAILVDLSEEDRNRALGEALSQMMAELA